MTLYLFLGFLFSLCSQIIHIVSENFEGKRVSVSWLALRTTLDMVLWPLMLAYRPLKGLDLVKTP